VGRSGEKRRNISCFHKEMGVETLLLFYKDHSVTSTVPYLCLRVWKADGGCLHSGNQDPSPWELSSTHPLSGLGRLLSWVMPDDTSEMG
jgi:hypothetical protein